MKNRKSDVLSYNNEAFREIHNTTSLIDAVLTCCQDKEFRGIYYDIPRKSAIKLSEERNGYMSLLTMASDRLNNLKQLNINIENELTLHQNTDNCC